MPSSAFTLFNSFTEALGRKVHNLNADTLKIMLTNSVPALSASVKADLTEITPQFGYSAGGPSVGTHDWTQTAGIAKLTIAADPVITAAGGSVGPFRCPVLYNDTAAGKELIGFWDYGSNQAINDGEPLLIDVNQANGLFTI